MANPDRISGMYQPRTSPCESTQTRAGSLVRSIRGWVVAWLALAGAMSGCSSDSATTPSVPATSSKSSAADSVAAPVRPAEPVPEPLSRRTLAVPKEADGVVAAELLREIEQRQSGTPRKIPARDEAPTGAAFAALRRKFDRDLMVEGYQRGGLRSPDWDQNVTQFLEQYHQFQSTGMTPQALAELRQMGTAVIEKGCTDPLVRLVLAELWTGFEGAKDYYRARKLLGEAESRWEETQYSSPLLYRAAILAANLANRDRDRPNPEEVERLVLRAIDQFVKATEGTTYTPEQQRIFVRYYSRDFTDSLIGYSSALVERLRASSTANPWIKGLLEGFEQTRLAWNQFEKVQQGDQARAQEFMLRLLRARVVLIEAWKLQPQFPEAPAALIQASASLGGAVPESPRFWFDEAVRAEVDYTPAYDTLRWTFSLSWRDNSQALLKFGEECLQSGRFDTEIPLQYPTIVNRLAGPQRKEVRGKPIFREPGVYAHYRETLLGYRSKTEDPKEQLRLDSLIAAVAWLSGNDDDARQLLESLGEKVQSKAFREVGASLTEAKQELLPASTSSDGSFLPDDGKFWGHSRGITATAFTPDGKFLITGGKEGMLRLWDVATGQSVRDFAGKQEEILAVAVSPDGQHLAAGCLDGWTRVWTIATGKPRCALRQPQVPAVVAFSPDGKWFVTGGPDNYGVPELCLWSAENWQLVGRFTGPQMPVASVVFSPDSRRLVATYGRLRTITRELQDTMPDVVVWDLATRKALHRWRPFQHTAQHAVFSGDGRMLAVCGIDEGGFTGPMIRSFVRVYDVESGAAVQLIPGSEYDGSFASLAVLPDGQTLVTASTLGVLRYWELTTGKPVAAFHGHSGEITDMDVAPTSHLLAAVDQRGRVRIWPTETATLRSQIRADISRFRFTNGAQSLRPAADAQSLLVFSRTTGLSRWEANEQGIAARNVPPPTPDFLMDADESPDRRWIAVCSLDPHAWQSSLLLLDSSTGKVVSPLSGHLGTVNAVRFSPDGQTIASAGDDRTIRLWKTESREPWTHGVLQEHIHQIGRLEYSRDGRLLASGSVDGVVKLWEVPERLTDLTKPPLSLRTVRCHATKIECLAFSPDGKHVLTGSDVVELWEVETGQLLRTLPGSHAACSPDGKWIATGGGELGGEVCIWDAATGAEVCRTLAGHDGTVVSVAFTPDSQHLFTSGEEGFILCWDALTGRPAPGFAGLRSRR